MQAPSSGVRSDPEVRMDLIRHRCGGCEAVLWSSARLVGLPIRCEICRRDNEVPPESSDEARGPRGRPPRPRPRGSILPLLVGLSFVLVGCLATAAGVYVLRQTPPTAPVGPPKPAEVS